MKTYRVTIENKSNIENFTLTAENLKAAKNRANFIKRLENLKGITKVNYIKK